MPLPPNSSLSLLPHTNPGESGYSKPKNAMIVRMSSDTLSALQSYDGDKPQLHFEFGDIPGIHIGSTFYPMRPLKEDAPHELYLRTTSATKPSAPLKHYANVTGKFTVEREIGESIKDKLREKTSDAAKQKDDRRTIFIDAPPPPPTNSRKRKDHTSSMFRHAVRPADQAKLNAAMSSSTASARVPSPAPSKIKPSNASAHMRKRLVHFLAVSERPRDMIVKMVGGTDCDASTRQELLEILAEVGELASPLKRGEDPTTKVWRLRTGAWKEVRPFGWPGLQEKERLAMSRTGKQKIHSLGIKSSDPLWEHFEYRALTNNHIAEPSSSSSVSSASSSSSSREGEPKTTEILPKRGVSSKELKEKKAKPKPNNANVQIKDKATAAGGKAKESDLLSQPKTKPSAAGRKLPGSGFKMGKTPPTGREPSDSPNLNSLPKSVDVRTGPTPSLPARPLPPISPPNVQEKKLPATQRIRKSRDSDATVAGTESERERFSERSKEKGKGRVVKEEVESGRRPDLKEVVPHKRKQVAHDDDDSDTTASKSGPQKKRKTDANTIPATLPSKETKIRDLSLPKKPELGPPRAKTHKEPSPLPPPSPLPKIKKESAATAKIPRDAKEPAPSQKTRNDPSKTTGTSKARRKSPVFTSSEDEGEIRRPKRESLIGPLPTPPSATNPSSNQSPTYAPQRPARPLPTEHAALRARYKSRYGEYLTVYHKVWTQRGKIQNLLDRGDGYGSTAESDGGDLMDSEDLSRLSLDYQRLHEELMDMRAKFDR